MNIFQHMAPFLFTLIHRNFPSKMYQRVFFLLSTVNCLL